MFTSSGPRRSSISPFRSRKSPSQPPPPAKSGAATHSVFHDVISAAFETLGFSRNIRKPKPQPAHSRT
ncbi:hypothetical protein Pint_08142 [Pistacia integerrima]|uniref:Uncharacterized protein n=1 Tax=Pistacia integerrima TaxID=434235 RepID=A0ACC0XWP4_9ROSI|nr:hypothetical protein Pint_08142 [Pistacia integerrima]